MGEAEDIVLRQLAQNKSDKEAETARHIQEFVEQLEEVVPQVIEHLRASNYSIEYGREVVKVDGEPRIGWQIGSQFDDYIYLLADGTFSMAAYLSPGCSPLSAQALGNICTYIGNQQNIIKKLKDLLVL